MRQPPFCFQAAQTLFSSGNGISGERYRSILPHGLLLSGHGMLQAYLLWLLTS
jgi:hypothetical protein